MDSLSLLHESTEVGWLLAERNTSGAGLRRSASKAEFVTGIDIVLDFWTKELS